MSAITDFLIVDDELEWRQRLREMVGGGFSVKEAGSLEEALSAIRTQYFHCALVDKSLIRGQGEDEGGMRVLEALSNSGEGTKGLMLTNFPDYPSTKAALRQWDVTDYVAKNEFTSIEGFKKLQDRIQKMLDDAKSEYARRYSSGIDQLTASFDARDRAGWESSLITNLSAPGHRVDYKLLAQFLDNLIRDLPPLLPFNSGNSPKLNKENKTVEGEYWSKGLGEAIVIKFGRKSDIEVEKESISPEKVIRYVDKSSLGGLIFRTVLNFEELLPSDNKG